MHKALFLNFPSVFSMLYLINEKETKDQSMTNLVISTKRVLSNSLAASSNFSALSLCLICPLTLRENGIQQWDLFLSLSTRITKSQQRNQKRDCGEDMDCLCSCKGGTAILVAQSFGRFGTVNFGVVNIRREQVLA